MTIKKAAKRFLENAKIKRPAAKRKPAIKILDRDEIEGIIREQAYKLVQNNAMKAWQEKENFLSLLEADEEILTHLSKSELASLFDYNYYLKYVDTIFERLKLNKAQGSI